MQPDSTASAWRLEAFSQASTGVPLCRLPPPRPPFKPKHLEEGRRVALTGTYIPYELAPAHTQSRRCMVKNQVLFVHTGPMGPPPQRGWLLLPICHASFQRSPICLTFELNPCGGERPLFGYARCTPFICHAKFISTLHIHSDQETWMTPGFRHLPGPKVRAQPAPCVTTDDKRSPHEQGHTARNAWPAGAVRGSPGPGSGTPTLRHRTAGRSPWLADPWRGAAAHSRPGCSAEAAGRGGLCGRGRRPRPVARPARPPRVPAPPRARTGADRPTDGLTAPLTASRAPRRRRSPRARSGSARRPPRSAAPGWGAACAPSPGCPCPTARHPLLPRGRSALAPPSGRAAPRPALRRRHGVTARAGARGEGRRVPRAAPGWEWWQVGCQDGRGLGVWARE